VSARRGVSAKVAKRRALVFDLVCGMLLAIGAIAVAAGMGIVAVGALVALLIALASVGIEVALARARR
jgi:hypothetical protein